MTSLDSIKHGIRSLPQNELWKLQDWFAEYMDGQEQLDPQFIVVIERGREDVRQGRIRLE